MKIRQLTKMLLGGQMDESTDTINKTIVLCDTRKVG
jgi:hypothetical protein